MTETATNVSVESVSPDEYATRAVTVDFLYLDREECTRCRDTDDVLDEAIDRVAPLLADLDVEIERRNVHVDSERAARMTGLTVSPTIRVDGRDVHADPLVSTCESCGDLCDCGEDIDCRLWAYRGEEYETPPVEMLIDAILRGAVTAAEDAKHRVAPLPANLQQFFGTESEETDDSNGCC